MFDFLEDITTAVVDTALDSTLLKVELGLAAIGLASKVIDDFIEEDDDN